ncbi:histidine--tRNA ligase [Candidatus Falkowbacteria bacterium]|uniref:Histidine--tRNA ligase n=1 Tax=Candidatus Falkowbacteria bacterium CG10_big_fil_rev_8_21_14_0_10_37_18 TaxID=1974562 RepID=A0A2H0VC32_9BACT|nr:histidine--tRNA ligase [Candidatus Falkowbacteria bacterium]NCQ12949.1 histidine--tRNA ligase [Candidatus Falkowbacteria bacterium]PIR95860.1 MAG: histidine--tRNA ligase [Candidatus Falkowbacteria bacterium CG10_big_fil_rev_8_21_14_0_10_37_18]
MSKILSNQEPKGTRDWLPEEFLIRKYIFDTWRDVCLRYSFEEYLTPLVESAEIYRAKSGEDVGGKELVTFRDLGDRELSIRPEMTPSVTRLVTKIYRSSPKPLKYFSIANFMRNEKPQRGRNREFWQLNCDIFGSDSLRADQEILQLALDIVLEFDPPADSFVLYLSSRKLLENVLELSGSNSLTADDKINVVRILDKWNKLKESEINERLEKTGLTESGLMLLKKFMSVRSLEDLAEQIPELKNNDGFKEVASSLDFLKNLGYGDWVEFNPAVIRGFDYYDGLVFEVFDNNPANTRAMFGGGRYNGLAEIFGEKNFPAVGFAPGDETIRLFLESWNLLDVVKKQQAEKYYLPLLNVSLSADVSRLAKELRGQGLAVFVGLEEQKIAKALEFANKREMAKVVIFGEAELEQGVYKIKDMLSGEEITKKL